MVSRFEQLPPELQHMVANRLLFSDVMEICQTSKRIRGDRCRDLLAVWLKQHVPGAFETDSPYKDSASPTEWIKIYTEGQLQPVIDTLVYVQNALAGVRVAPLNPVSRPNLTRLINAWSTKVIHLDRLPVRAASNYTALWNSLQMLRTLIGDVAKGAFRKEEQALLITQFIVVCSKSRLLRDLVGYTDERWRNLILKCRYQDGASFRFVRAPIFDVQFVLNLLRPQPFNAEDLSLEVDSDEYNWLLVNRLITLSWDSLLRQLSKVARIGEGRLLKALKTRLISEPGTAALETGIARSRPWPALRRMLLEAKDAVDRKEAELRAGLSAGNLDRRISLRTAATKISQKATSLLEEQLGRTASFAEKQRFIQSVMINAVRSYRGTGQQDDPQADFEAHVMRTMAVTPVSPPPQMARPTPSGFAAAVPLLTAIPLPPQPTRVTSGFLNGLSDKRLSELPDELIRSFTLAQLDFLRAKVEATLSRVTQDAEARRRSASKISGLQRVRNTVAGLLQRAQSAGPSGSQP